MTSSGPQVTHLPRTTSLTTRLLTAAGFLAFFAFGFVDNLKGPLLPEVLRDEGLSYSQGGAFFLAAYVGFVIATLLTGVLSDVLSNRRVLGLSSLCLVVGSLGLNLGGSFPLLTCCMGIIGLGLGGIEVGGNALMVDLHSHKRAQYLNLLATFHGVGSLVVPLVAAWLISRQLAWEQIYISAGGLALAVMALLLISGNPRGEVPPVRERWQWQQVVRQSFTRRMMWFYLLISAYVAVELGIAAWLVEYLQQVHGLSVAVSSLYLSGFFLMIMLGRLLGSWWVERIGYLRMVGLSLVGSLLLLGVGLYGPGPARWLLPLSGGCMSVVFPTVTAAVSAAHTQHVGSLLGMLFTFGGLGGALGPWVIGLISQRYGLQVGLSATLGFGCVALLALANLRERRPMR